MSDLRVLAAAVLLAAGVAAAVPAATIRFGGDPAPRIAPAIATVRLGQLTADYAVRAAGSGASAEASAARTRAWAAALENALAIVSRRHRAVLLPARAVAAGAPDLTDEVEAALAAAMTKAGAPAERAAPVPEARP